jgi:hypothetical protein
MGMGKVTSVTEHDVLSQSPSTTPNFSVISLLTRTLRNVAQPRLHQSRVLTTW